MGVETFSGLIARVIEAARIFEAAEALENAPEEHPVAWEKKDGGTARQVCRCLRRRRERGALRCILSRKAQQYSPFQRSLPVAGYCAEEAELELDFVRRVFG